MEEHRRLTRRIRSIVIVSVSLAAVLLSSTASAGSHTIAGSACHANGSGSPCATYGPISLNTTAQSCAVSCPMVRHNIFNVNGLTGVWVNGRNFGCTIQASTSSGGFVDSQYRSSSSSANLFFNGINSSSNTGVYSAYCTIFPGGEIQRLRWDEP